MVSAADPIEIKLTEEMKHKANSNEKIGKRALIPPTLISTPIGEKLLMIDNTILFLVKAFHKIRFFRAVAILRRARWKPRWKD